MFKYCSGEKKIISVHAKCTKVKSTLKLIKATLYTAG